MTSRVEYALQLACDLNGCAEPHGDDGDVIGGSLTGERIEYARSRGERPTINGHACRVVQRTVTITDWVEGEPDA